MTSPAIHIAGGLSNIRRPAHNRRHQVILLYARPTGSIANGGVIVDVVLKTHGGGVGGRIVVIGIRAVKVMSINFSGMIQGRRSRRWGRIARQTDGRNAAVWRVVLGDMQIIKIQTIRCTKAKSDRRGDAVTLILTLSRPASCVFSPITFRRTAVVSPMT